MNRAIQYQNIEALRVLLFLNGAWVFVGRLVYQEKKIWYEYDPAFIKTHGLELSPFKLPLQMGAVTCDDSIFQGLFGLFDDSLPDGWGRLLLDMYSPSPGLRPPSPTRGEGKKTGHPLLMGEKKRATSYAPLFKGG